MVGFHIASTSDINNPGCLLITTDATTLYNSYFGNGEGPYHLSGLDCHGNESTLLDCPRYRTIGYHQCSSGNDAGVRCDGMYTMKLYLYCSYTRLLCFCNLQLQYAIMVKHVFLVATVMAMVWLRFVSMAFGQIFAPMNLLLDQLT